MINATGIQIFVVSIHSGDICDQTQTPLPRRTRVTVYDLRAHNIDFLRRSISQCDWNQMFASDDIQFIYDTFLFNVQILIEQCIPAKLVAVGPRDPPYVTPLIKSLLRKRQRLRKRGHVNDANVLAATRKPS